MYQSNSFNEGCSGEFVFSHTNHRTWCFGSTVQHSFDSFDTLHCSQHSVERTGNTTSLGVPKGCDASIEFEFVSEQISEMLRCDGI